MMRSMRCTVSATTRAAATTLMLPVASSRCSSSTHTAVATGVPPAVKHADIQTTPRGNATTEELTGAVELRRRTVQRATNEEREGFEVVPGGNLTEEDKWWPPVNNNYSGRMFGGGLDKTIKRKDALNVVELKELPSPDRPEMMSARKAYFMSEEASGMLMSDEVYDQTMKIPAPATFDPAIDEIDDEGFQDQHVVVDVLKAVDEDKRRLEAFGNPVTVDEQVDVLLQPQRGTQESVAQRQEFNGFTHWGLLHAAHMLMDENQDFKRAHELVNRYMRDIDLFKKWLHHPKVVAHMQKKFGVDITGKYDPVAAITLSLYTRSKIQVFEDDAAGALKSLMAAVSMLSEGVNLKLERHRKLYGAVLIARGMVYTKLKSFERAEDDLTRALAFVNPNRSPTLFQLRAEAREGQGKIEEARQDEEAAAMMWETADVVRPGLAGEPKKFVV